MRFKEKTYGGYTLRFCDLPSHYTVSSYGHRVAGARAMVLRHWKVMNDGTTATTAPTLARAKEKVRALNEKERSLK